MRLIPAWRLVLARAWSVRLIVLSGLLSGAEVALQVLPPDALPLAPLTFAAASAAVSTAALAARIIAQKDITDA